uniref:Clu domain-containing protein n=1 Tax=Soboliphyme baturini TaxID=241478 RepID=A0A183J3F1_9BILA
LLSLIPSPIGSQSTLIPLLLTSFVVYAAVVVDGVVGFVPQPQRDLLYLAVLTLEEKRFYITCCTKGFFVNQSTETEFSPKAVSPKFISHSLIELLCHVPFAFKLGYEEHIPGQTREWNEELQTTRELPRKTLPERLLRERAIFKVYSDFVAAATKGAVVVVDGNVMAINPGENPKMQMFIWNNIFFSLGFDVKDHYKDFGGDAAAFVAPVHLVFDFGDIFNNDLQGVKAYFNLDPEGLFLLGTVVVDYMGYRVTAQSIIPGILEKDQEQSVVYGSVDFGKTVVTSEKYLELLNRCAQQLKILPHRVKSENGDVVKLNSSVESKGIIGNDGRHYILDLLRTFPPDVHYLPGTSVEGRCFFSYAL